MRCRPRRERGEVRRARGGQRTGAAFDGEGFFETLWVDNTFPVLASRTVTVSPASPESDGFTVLVIMTRSMPLWICCDQPPISWSKRTGIASIRWVRPVLVTPFSALAFLSMALASVIMSGSTPHRSKPHSVPSRPTPVWTSSRMNSSPCSLSHSLSGCSDRGRTTLQVADLVSHRPERVLDLGQESADLDEPPS